LFSNSGYFIAAAVIEYAIKTVQEDLLEFEWNGLQDSFFKVILCYLYCAFSYIQYINQQNALSKIQ